MRMRHTPLLLLTGLTVGFAAHAGEPPAAPAQDTGFEASATVAVDPSTGRLRQPTAAERTELQAKAAQLHSGQRATMPRNEAEAQRTLRKLPAGGYQIDVPEDRMSTLNATVQADGSVRIHHGDGHHAQEAGHE